MDNNDYTKLLAELVLIRRGLQEQENRLKKIEDELAHRAPHKESSLHAGVSSFESSGESVEKLHERPLVQKKLQKANTGGSKRSWWVLFELYSGHYALQFFGAILFFVGIFLSVNHAVKVGLISPQSGMYGCITAGMLLALLGGYLRKRAFVEAAMALEGALVLVYGAFFVGYREYALFSLSTAYAGITFVSLASLSVAFAYSSRLFAFLGLIFGMSLLVLYRPLDMLVVSIYPYLFSVMTGAVVLSLIKRWYSVALVSYACMWFIAAAHSITSSHLTLSLPQLFSAIVLFTVVPPLYALFRGRDVLLESVITGIAATTFFSGPLLIRMNDIFAALARSVPAFSHAEMLPRHLKMSILCVLAGTFFLIELLVFLRKNAELFPLKATIYGLVYMFFSGALLSLVPAAPLISHCSAWLCGGLCLWKGSTFWLQVGIGLELYTWLMFVFSEAYGPGVGFATSLGIGISILAVGVLSLLSYGIAYRWLSDDDCGVYDASSCWRDRVYAFGAASPLYLWAVALHTTWIALYVGPLVGLYGSAVIMAAQGTHRTITASVGYVALCFGYFYALYRYLFFFEGAIHGWGMTAPMSKLAILKEATILLGGLILIGVFLYIGMQYRKEHAGNYLYTRMHPFIGGMTSFLLFLLIRLYLICGVHYYALASQARNSFTSFVHFLRTGSSSKVYSPNAERNLLTAYYALTGLLLIAVGSVYKKSQMRLIGIGVLLLNTIFILSALGFRSMGLAEELVIMSIGAIVLGASLFYRRLSSR